MQTFITPSLLHMDVTVYEVGIKKMPDGLAVVSRQSTICRTTVRHGKQRLAIAKTCFDRDYHQLCRLAAWPQTKILDFLAFWVHQAAAIALALPKRT